MGGLSPDGDLSNFELEPIQIKIQSIVSNFEDKKLLKTNSREKKSIEIRETIVAKNGNVLVILDAFEHGVGDEGVGDVVGGAEPVNCCAKHSKRLMSNCNNID